MPNTGLINGPYALTNESIDEHIARTSSGVYVLERSRKVGSFVVDYVGRSDSDVNGRLKKWVGKNRYKRFKFGYFSSPKSAFDKECEIYHNFNNLDNDIHPQRPAGTDWECLYCEVFDE